MEIDKIKLEYLKVEDYKELRNAMQASYTGMPEELWNEKQISILLEKFPEGQVVIKIDGKLAGCALALIVDYDLFDSNHTYDMVTGNYTFDTHNAQGDVLYGIDVFITPEFRGLG